KKLSHLVIEKASPEKLMSSLSSKLLITHARSSPRAAGTLDTLRGYSQKAIFNEAAIRIQATRSADDLKPFYEGLQNILSYGNFRFDTASVQGLYSIANSLGKNSTSIDIAQGKN